MLRLRRNILILHSGALGDFVLSWPLGLALARAHPQSRIIVVTHASKGALAEAALRVESADIEGGWHGIFVADGRVTDSASTLLSGAQSIYSFLSSDADVVTSNLRRLASDALVVTLRPRPPAGYSAHASAFLAAQLQTHPVLGVAIQQMLRSLAQRGLGFSGGSGGVVIHPGSGSAHKNWPLQSFVQLTRRLRLSGYAVRVLLGEVEQEKWSPHHQSAFAAEAVVKTPATYVDLFNELKTASLVIANDSGPGHLAAVMGLPTLSLFGPTDPSVWKPLGPHVTTLRKEPLKALSVEEVHEAAEKILAL